MKKSTKEKVKLLRTEQWEWTAYYNGISATGSSEESAELNVLRKYLGLK